MQEARIGLVEIAGVLGADHVLGDEDLAAAGRPLGERFDLRVVDGLDLGLVAEILNDRSQREQRETVLVEVDLPRRKLLTHVVDGHGVLGRVRAP